MIVSFTSKNVTVVVFVQILLTSVGVYQLRKRPKSMLPSDHSYPRREKENGKGRKGKQIGHPRVVSARVFGVVGKSEHSIAANPLTPDRTLLRSHDLNLSVVTQMQMCKNTFDSWFSSDHRATSFDPPVLKASCSPQPLLRLRIRTQQLASS